MDNQQNQFQQAISNASTSGGQQQVGFGEGLDKINRDFVEKSVRQKAAQVGLPYIDIAKTVINPDALRTISFEQAQKAKLIPFLQIGPRLGVALVDPETRETREALEFLKNQKFEVSVHLCSEIGLLEALKGYQPITDAAKKQELVKNIEHDRIASYDKEIALMSDMSEKVAKLSAEEALNFIEVGAMKTNASDIHYEPEEKTVHVRFRIDGVLHRIFDLDPKVYVNLVNQIKYRSKMKLNITTIAQDGRYSFDLNDRKIDVRVSDIPTEFGESFVCRLLDSGRGAMNFESMGFAGSGLEKMNKLSDLSHGMILVTGPTGSGKTTTLYALLSKFNQPDTKVITLEDPVEYRLSGIVQSQIDEPRGYTFASGLRAILRQDPDVVMIGEIRDLETANTAAQAALTGHVLLSTLHTNSAVESIPRLINMGMPEFMIAPALHTLVGQRLVRRVCECHSMEAPQASEIEQMQKTLDAVNAMYPDLKLTMPATIPRPVGCDTCSKTGYKGRLVIAEILTMDSELEQLVLQKAGVGKLFETARKKGMITMQEDGVMKVMQGLTTLDEVFRATNMNL